MTALEFSQYFDTPLQCLALSLCALFAGMSKTGIQSITILSVPLMAAAFGTKPSTGLTLPILCFADLIAVIYYRRSAKRRLVVKLLPWAIAGFFLALVVDRIVPADRFGLLMALSIFVGLPAMFCKTRPDTANNRLAPLFGLAGGFSTMIGNAAGPIMAIYLLTMRLPKLAFVGTSAWFFMTVNYLKIPLQAFVWNNITPTTLLVNLTTVPLILLGAATGIVFTKKIPERAYRVFIITVTILSTIFIALQNS
jgi:uncharacterized membrane protein YfcA